MNTNKSNNQMMKNSLKELRSDQDLTWDELNNWSGVLYDEQSQQEERIGDLEDFAKLIYEHVRLTFSELASLHDSLVKVGVIPSDGNKS